jgi:MFS family permease
MPVVADQPKSQPAGLHAMLVLICVSAPSFMLQLDANIVAVSLPSISESLGATFAGIEWVITAYTLSFASLFAAGGSARRPLWAQTRVDRRTWSVHFSLVLLWCGAKS